MRVGFASDVSYLPGRERRTNLTGQIVEICAPVVVLVWFLETIEVPVLES